MAATKEKIESIELEDRNILGKYPEEKLGIVDLKATLDNGTICDVEIQLADNKDTAERFLYYWSRIYSGQLIKGDIYGNLNKVIGVIIIDYEFKKTVDIENLSTKWKIKEVSTGKNIELTDMLELYIIEIPKARKILQQEPNNTLAQWIMFINDPNESEVLKIMEQNEAIREAMKELEEISKDKELRLVAELKEKAIRDEQNGLIRNREEGIKEGIKKGEKEARRVIAKKLKEENIPVEIIIKTTELSEKEINEL